MNGYSLPLAVFVFCSIREPGRIASRPTSHKKPKNVQPDSEPELEGYVPPPPKQSIGDALAQALEQACTFDKNSAAHDESVNHENSNSGKKKGKKMKGKKILLSSGARPHL